jgi:hypothetical protein
MEYTFSRIVHVKMMYQYNILCHQDHQEQKYYTIGCKYNSDEQLLNPSNHITESRTLVPKIKELGYAM